MADGKCRPLHILAALAELDGAIGAALRPDRDGPLYDGPSQHSGGSGAMGTYLCGQVQHGARLYASQRGEPMLPEHLLVVLIDQRDAEVMTQLASVGLDPSTLRRAALAELGEPLDRPVLELPAPTPAGTMDRPALEIGELEPRAWAVLVWRQQRLPLDRVQRPSDWYALSSAEQRAAWKIADAAGVDDDQRYSLIARHAAEVECRGHSAHPWITDSPVGRSAPAGHQSQPIIGLTLHSRRRLRRLVPNFMIGWPTWFANRQVGMRDLMFRLKTFRTFRGQPKIGS